MKGLLIKDFRLLGVQKNFFFVIFVVAVGISIISEDSLFMVGFLSLVMSLFTLSTISYDEFDNGNAFLFTLPISRGGYAVEKYCFGLLLGGGTWILAMLAAFMISGFKGTISVPNSLISGLAILPVMLLMQAVMIPFQLKFGSEKGRIAMISTVGVVFAIGYAVMEMMETIGVDMRNAAVYFSAMHISIISVILVLFSVVLLLISLRISISIMDKKEF